jgi:uncharacterized membrane protein YphA (DoxX/SURF4 family)
MLNLFPIQFLAPLAFALLRIVLGLICLRYGRRLLRANSIGIATRITGIVYLLAGAGFMLGLFTQIASLILIALLIVTFIRPQGSHALPRSTLVLMGAIALSLFITGAGLFAFDLPI